MEGFRAPAVSASHSKKAHDTFKITMETSKTLFRRKGFSVILTSQFGWKGILPICICWQNVS